MASREAAAAAKTAATRNRQRPRLSFDNDSDDSDDEDDSNVKSRGGGDNGVSYEAFQVGRDGEKLVLIGRLQKKTLVDLVNKDKAIK